MTSTYKETEAGDLRANQPSSSSLRVLAGKGAPGPSFSYRGRRTPPPPKGLSDCSLPNIGVFALLLVLAGTAGSRLLHPKLFIESLNDADAMDVTVCACVIVRTLNLRLALAFDASPCMYQAAACRLGPGVRASNPTARARSCAACRDDAG